MQHLQFQATCSLSNVITLMRAMRTNKLSINRTIIRGKQKPHRKLVGLFISTKRFVIYYLVMIVAVLVSLSKDTMAPNALPIAASGT